MLMHPFTIVALVLYLIAGPLTISQRFQTRFRSFGYGIHQKISSVLSLPGTSLEPQDYPVAFEATTVEALPIAPVETDVIHPVEIVSSFLGPFEDHVGAIIQEACPTRDNDNPSPTLVRVFVVSSEYQGPFDWQDLFSYWVPNMLTAICFSIWLPLVIFPLVAKLFSRSDSLDETEQPVDAPPKLLPPKILAPPKKFQIFNPKSHAPLEPIFSPAPSESSTFWLASEQKQQDQPSPPTPPLLRLLDFSALENEPQKKLSPLTSPADSGYGTTLSDTTSDASPLAFGENVTTTPERLAEPSLTAYAESTLMYDSNSVATISDNFTGNRVNTTKFGTELEDDGDDGSSTVTNSTANLADIVVCPVPIPAEVLLDKLESLSAASIKGSRSLSEPPAEESSVTVLPSDDLTTDLPSRDEPTMEEDEALVEDDPPSQDDSEQDVEPWTPDYEVPDITISPPSEVDPEDPAPQLDSEDEQEGSEDLVGHGFYGELEPESGYDDELWLEYADGYSDNSSAEVVSELPPSPVEARESPFRSPIITTGTLWTEYEGDDLGPLPFSKVKHVEVFDDLERATLETRDAETAERPEAIDAAEQTEGQDFPSEEEISDTVAAVSENMNIEESVAKATQQPIEEPQPVPEAPAQAVPEPAPIELVPPTSPSPSHQSPPCASRSLPIHTQASFDNRGRGEGRSSRSGRTTETPRPQYYHCCKLHRSDGRPRSWENWKIEKSAGCIPKKTNLHEWQFVCPTDKDGENPTTRIAIDNLDADWFRMVDGILSYNYLTEAMGFFSTKSFRCWRGRTIDGVEYASIGYATVNFGSIDDAIAMFNELQGRRLRGHTWHWRLEFVDPNDDTHGGRKVIRTELVPDSVKQALAAELEASTKRRGRSGHADDGGNGAAVVTRPPARVRPQLSIGARSLLSGTMSNIVQGRRTEERPAQSTTRVPPRRPYRS